MAIASNTDNTNKLTVFSETVGPKNLSQRYQQVRHFTERLCQPLVTEDYVIQAMPDVSPPKWHLAHTSWFFETFILTLAPSGYQAYDPSYGYLFNSYYLTVGERHSRPKRGLLSRPTVDEIYRYRAWVDQHMITLLEGFHTEECERWAPLIELGLHHEQQHQELLLTDVKYNFACNPLRPVYAVGNVSRHPLAVAPLQWVGFPEGVYWIGHDGKGFAFDNESPRHRTFVEAFELGSRLITNAEYLTFIANRGYERPELWLSMGWDAVQREGWRAPLYWEQHDGNWWMMTLSGMQPVQHAEPICHVSYYEADAYARWANARLPTEEEWEVAATPLPVIGNFVEDQAFHPVSIRETESTALLTQMFGDVWEWTQSHYSPYPGFISASGSVGEYNGKFMANQFVLRGGSCATAASHIRPTYRNFFPAEARWQFMGIRLAKTIHK